MALDWYNNTSRAESGTYSVVFELHNTGTYSVVFELHNTVLPVTGTFDAVVATSMFYDLGGHVDGALHYPLQAA